ncbi:phenylalanine--tRNA ligase subunit beta [Parasediminibacterium sp. JCM 36343]|uniref:phenylalanine--tRNA ligase subunit beta n=1 Tax=Parasediminibacterium sp. JCM 36343 TaxID=3374279 RepID=UPI00397B1F69
MTISYNWLSEYLPESIEPEKLSKILTSIGLEVESMEPYESIKGGLKGLVLGEVLTCEPHPNADKLKITTVNIGSGEPIQVVCGAANVAAGQKVVVATVGTTIYPSTGDPLTMKVAKIRGVESFGMICAEDEIGHGTSHEGILVLPNEVVPGTPAAAFFNTYTDIVYEIGLTPNRMDAMSHLGVAKDVCAYLIHHFKGEPKVKSPFVNAFPIENTQLVIPVTVEDTAACPRYAGVTISDLTVKESPEWLKNKLNAIGLRSINNVVDITNFILHETGQPLHAFDADQIEGGSIIVKKAIADSLFTTLDEKERKLSAEDLLICNSNGEPMCIAGVFGGLHSGVTASTTNIFLESACFASSGIRKSSLRHGLRTDAATRFEKGVDISNTVHVLKRAALLIKEVAGGSISSEIIDIYPAPKTKTQVGLKYQYLKKLSGKNYHPDTVKRILIALGFDINREGIDELSVSVPFSKPDISLPADIVEEVIRIDGLDNIGIPTTITISPSINSLGQKEALKDKLATYLVGQGFNEIVTNSITNSKYFDEATLEGTVKMMNNLSADLDVLRPSMLETGLECIAYNSNRKNTNLQLFEFGKSYHAKGVGSYREDEHLALYITGNNHEDNWQEKAKPMDFFRAKGIAQALFNLCGLDNLKFSQDEGNTIITISHAKQAIGYVTTVGNAKLKTFDIKQAVYFIDILFVPLLQQIEKKKIEYKEVSKFPAVQRDLALVVDKATTYGKLETVVKKANLAKLQSMRLFDVFESDKLGAGKKSMAVNFTFLDDEKTLTDKETDSMVGKIVEAFEKELGAEIRK